MISMLTDYAVPNTASPDRAPERRPQERWEFSTWLVAAICLFPLFAAGIVALLH